MFRQSPQRVVPLHLQQPAQTPAPCKGNATGTLQHQSVALRCAGNGSCLCLESNLKLLGSIGSMDSLYQDIQRLNYFLDTRTKVIHVHAVGYWITRVPG